MRSHEFFRRFAHATAAAIGSPYVFLGALACVVIWAACGPLFGYSDSWQLVINTGTTIATFLVVFLIQNTQNRDSQALHLKLDELIRALRAARNTMVDIEKLPDEELARLEKEFRQLRLRGDPPPGKRARADDQPGRQDAPARPDPSMSMSSTRPDPPGPPSAGPRRSGGRP